MECLGRSVEVGVKSVLDGVLDALVLGDVRIDARSRGKYLLSALPSRCSGLFWNVLECSGMFGMFESVWCVCEVCGMFENVLECSGVFGMFGMFGMFEMFEMFGKVRECSDGRARFVAAARGPAGLASHSFKLPRAATLQIPSSNSPVTTKDSRIIESSPFRSTLSDRWSCLEFPMA